LHYPQLNCSTVNSPSQNHYGYRGHLSFATQVPSLYTVLVYFQQEGRKEGRKEASKGKSPHHKVLHPQLRGFASRELMARGMVACKLAAIGIITITNVNNFIN
jgi:hypothetical protein